MPEPLNEHISQVTFIHATPEKVYDTITSADGWNAFFTHNSEIDPRPGGKFIWRWKNWGPDKYTVEVDGAVLEMHRPHKFVFEWGSSHPTKIEINLTAENNGTVLRLKESGYLDTPHARAMIVECASGWGEAITLLKFYLEHGIKYDSAK